MLTVVFIILVLIIILLLNIQSRQKNNEERTHKSFLSLKKELLQLNETLSIITAKDQTILPTDENVVQFRPEIPAHIIEPIEHKKAALSFVEEELIASFNTPVEQAEEQLQPADIIVQEEAIAPIETPVQPQVAPVPKESWSEKWLRNNPDLEKFIGEDLINKIGITVLVLGISFFVKYAIDQNWIKEAGRVAIGIGCGLALVGIAHYLRNTYRSFSSVLAGGGIAVFYFTIAFAFHEYAMFSQTAAFVIMIIITIFAVLLSLLYNKLELAVIAAIGGFATPFLISSGSGDYVALFTYLLILNAGMLALAWFKKWEPISVIALFFTLCIYGGWLLKNIIFSTQFNYYKNGLGFATAFYMLFVGMSVINNIRNQKPFKAFDFSLLMLITFSYYAAGMTNLNYWNNGAYQGLFTIALGTINFLLAGYLYKQQQADKNLLYLLIGLTLTFISLAAPVQLHGHTITLFWSAEFVLLYWLYQRSNIVIFKYSSLIVTALMLISLMIDWQKANAVQTDHLTVIYNNRQGFIANIVAVIAFTLYYLLLKKQQATSFYIASIKNSTAAVSMIVIGATIFYLTSIFGVNLYFFSLTNAPVANTWHQLISYAFVAILLLTINRFQITINVNLRLFLIAVCVGLYLISIPFVNDLRNAILHSKISTIQLAVHWLSAIIFLYLIYQAIVIYKKSIASTSTENPLFIWITNVVLILFFSVESMHAYVFLTGSSQNIDTALHQYFKAGITIVWALCSFIIMWQGMRHKYKTLRIISLSLFSLALVKLFLFDIKNINEGGKIAAFIMLGVLLLIISFMYQKLKKIIIDDSTA